MFNFHIVIGLEIISMAVIMFLLMIPMYKGSVGPNNYMGFRIKKSFESDELWYKINKYGARQMMIWSAALVIIGIASFFIPFNPAKPWTVFILLGAEIFILFIPIIQTLIYAKNL
ncbi:MAG: SdpI family protein [Armatimonadota bacterium]